MEHFFVCHHEYFALLIIFFGVDANCDPVGDPDDALPSIVVILVLFAYVLCLVGTVSEHVLPSAQWGQRYICTTDVANINNRLLMPKTTRVVSHYCMLYTDWHHVASDALQGEPESYYSMTLYVIQDENSDAEEELPQNTPDSAESKYHGTLDVYECDDKCGQCHMRPVGNYSRYCQMGRLWIHT
uniref:Fibronectin type-III domain-containing protein n=1 Tax=Panagrellus redivivus TaxID=6233 RepID=A0A7E4V4A2_PANRE